MSYANYDDIVAQLRGAGLMLGSVKKSNGGLAVGELYVESTRSVRCDVDGERKKSSGAYWLHEARLSDGTYIRGSYCLDHGNAWYPLDLNKVCVSCGADVPLKGANCPSCGGKKYKSRVIPQEQLEAHKARMAESRRQADVEAKVDADRAAAWANAVWLACREISSPDEHDYLARKKLKAAYGTRILDNHDGVMLDGAEKSDYEYLARFHGALVVPMLDKDGRRRGLQFILSREKHREMITKRDGRDKEFWPKGMLSRGMHYLIGGQVQSIGLVAEGFATAAGLHEATNLPVAVAFAANNLLPVGETIWKRSRKRARLLYCADDDWVQRCDTKTGGCGKYTPVAETSCKHCGHTHGKKNPGIEYSQSAALATSGAWIAPAFSAQRPDDRKGATDYNDLRCIEGEQAVGGQIAAKLSELAWITPSLAASRAGVPPQGGGENGIERAPMKSMLTIDEALERFALVFGGKSTIFDHQEHILVPKNDVLDILPEHGWRDMRATKQVVRMDEVGFDPACTDKKIKCNLWGGWPTVPKQGRCDVLIELLEYLCSEEENYRIVFDWVIKWIAYPIQHPGAKMRTALIFHGPQGTGKNLFFEAVMAIYGEYGRIVDQAAIEDKFNDWASRKLMMIADEVVARQELYHVKNKLKSFVTGEWIRINPKNVAAHDEKNHVNLVFLSNESQPLVLEKDDRRYTVIHTPEKLTAEFYQQVRAELNNGGIPALHHYLLNLDLVDFDEHTKPPMTKAKENLIDVSLDSVQRFISEWTAGDIESAPFCPCLGRHLFAVYRKWCDQLGERSPRSEAQFIGHIRNLHRWKAGESLATFETLNSTTKKNRKMIIPPDDYCSSSRIAVSKDGKTQQLWLTECFFQFSNKAGFDA